MKIVWVIGLTILATNLVQSVPTNQGLKGLTEDDEDMFMENQGEEPLEEDDLSFAEQGEQQEEKDDRNVDSELNSDLAEKEDDENDEEEELQKMKLSQYQKEVNDYFRVEKESNKHQRVRSQNSRGAIQSGSTIALQTFVKNRYLSCAGHVCGRSGCPRAHMDSHDWYRCQGEVFRIYRALGPGAVKVGDIVGLYYPRESGKWLGCDGPKCGKYTCPGQPYNHCGFSQRSKWNKCWGEVFRIYVKGKKKGDAVDSNDEISLYYVRERVWVSQGFHQTVKTHCLGKTLPPPVSKYDGCAHETFTIWEK